MKASFLAAGALVAIAAHSPALAQHGGHRPPAPEQPSQPPANHSDHRAPQPGTETPAADHSAHQLPAGEVAHEGMDHEMTGALGPYPMSREASGTAWQPDSSVHGGVHASAGD